MIVILEAPPNCELAFVNVITSPAACPVPPLVNVTVGVDEPSNTTLAVTPVPEPSELVCVIS